MPDANATLIGIAVMTVVTYLTRVVGYLLGARIPEGSRVYQVIQTLPGCALAAVVAPAIMLGTPLEIAALVCAAAVFYCTGRILASLMIGLLISVAGAHYLAGHLTGILGFLP